VGPTVASGILSVGPWQWLFAINVPLGVVALIVAARALPQSDRTRRPFDWGSAALNAVFFGLLVSGVDTLTHSRAHALAGCATLAVAIAAGVWLVRREMRLERPLVPLDLLKVPVFALSVCASICAFSAQMLAFVSLPFFFEGALHRTQVQTGLLITPWPLAVGVAAPLAGRLADKVSAAVLGIIGMGVFAVGLAALALLPKDAGTFDVVWRMALCGAGFGFFQSPNNRTMLSAAPRVRAGAAGGMLATARLTGQTAGATLVALFFRAAPLNGETMSLGLGAVTAVAAGVLSVLRAGRTHPVARGDAAAEPAE
jgi:DHA2 family multidrug resistance protein-like MFS transporter